MTTMTPNEAQAFINREEVREMIVEDPMWTGFKLGVLGGWVSMAIVYFVVKWFMAYTTGGAE